MKTRTQLIQYIVRNASDEIETIGDALDLAKMSIDQLKANVQAIKQHKTNLLHSDLRDILIKYNSTEYGDCIVDEICSLFGCPTTISNPHNPELSEIQKRLEWYAGGDGVEYELWIDPKTKIVYEVPIEIIRNHYQSKEFGKL